MSRLRRALGDPRVKGTLAIVVGTVAYVGGTWGVVQQGGRGAPPFVSYSAPDQPTATTTSPDTSTVIVLGSAFVGSGDDTHDSTEVQVFRVANDMSGTAMLTAIMGPQIRDTLASNDSLKADTTYKARIRYKGAAAKSAQWSAWSAPDTFVNSTQQSLVFVSSFNNGVGEEDAQTTDGGLWDIGYGGLVAAGYMQVVAKGDSECTGWPDDIVNVLQTRGTGATAVQNDTPNLGTLSDGHTMVVRAYLCWALPTVSANGNHPQWIRINGGSWNTQMLISVGDTETSGSAWNLSWWLNSDDCTTARPLEKFVVYRFEFALTRVGSDYTVEVGVWDAATEAQIYGGGDWLCGGTVMNVGTWSSAGFTNLDVLNGHNGHDSRTGQPDYVTVEESGWAIAIGAAATFPIGPFHASELN